MNEILLDVRELHTRLDSGGQTVRAVDGVSFQVRRGETFALLGESGCGKSMTALSILRLLPGAGQIESGEVRLDGQDLLTLPEAGMRKIRGRRVAMIFQEPQSSLNPVMSIGNQIGEVLSHHHGVRGGAQRTRVMELLDAVGIPDPAQRIREFPHQMSGGMKQRVMIAMALAGEPDLLIADEPTTALDVTIQAQVLALLKDLQAKTGMAVLLITHDLGVVAETADRVAVMYAGHVVESSDCKVFFRQPAHPYARKLFASLPTAERRGARLEVITGSVPLLTGTFAGCRFAPRCDVAQANCSDVPPVWQALEGEHGVRCHLYAPGQEIPADAGPLAPAVQVEESVADTPTGHGDTLLQVRGLKVHFPIQRGLLKRVVGNVHAVDGVDLDVARGQTLALVGESGCGKTTVGKSVLQLIPPTAGQVFFDGDDLGAASSEQMRKYRGHLQIIFQDPYASMNPRMTVADIVEEGMVAQNIGRDSGERRKRAGELLRQVGLDESARGRYPHEFSGGQRQRICIARALAVKPRLIVCDEPTSALDVSVQAQILNLLAGLQRDLGLAYLFISHDLSVVEYLAREVAVMYLGRIVEQGRVEDVLYQARHPYTQALLSAVPVIEPKTERSIIRLEGELPSPATPPTGCHFHPRCPQAEDRCRQEYPAPRKLSNGHWAACHLCAGD